MSKIIKIPDKFKTAADGLAEACKKVTESLHKFNHVKLPISKSKYHY